MTVARVAWLRPPISSDETGIDAVWELYWQFISAEVGLITASATAFRSFFISRTNEPITTSTEARTWYQKAQQLMRHTFFHQNWESRSSDSTATLSRVRGQINEIELPRISHDTMTGIQTFIDGHGRSTRATSRTRHNRRRGGIEDDDWGSVTTDMHGGIRVEHEISVKAESVSSKTKSLLSRFADVYCLGRS